MIKRMVIQNTLWTAFLAALLFVPAGTLRWPGAWAYLIIMTVIGSAMGLWLARHDPALLAERLKSPIQRAQKPWDKALIGTVVLACFVWLAFMALDAERWRWSHVPVAVQVVGALCLVVCLWVFYLVLRENSFAAPVVKIQRERNQRVVTTGPYALVRHPMYAGAILYFLGIPLLLGSWYGLAFVPVFIVAFAIRAVWEERTLIAGLEGYADYTARVRYRLIPGVW